MKKLLAGTATLSLLLAGCGQGEETKTEDTTKSSELKKEEKVTTEKPSTEVTSTEAPETVNPKEKYEKEFYPKMLTLVSESKDYWEDNWFDTFNPIRKTNNADGVLNKVTEIKEEMKMYGDQVDNLEDPRYFTADQKMYLEDIKKNLGSSISKNMMAASMLERNIKDDEVTEDNNQYVTEKAAESHKYYSDAMQSLDALNKSFK